MNLALETGVSSLTVFFQGLVSFFSPCVLPLIPLYIGYLSGGAKTTLPDGTVVYQKGRVLLNTLFFVIGISFAFFLLGLGFTAIGSFFKDYQAWFTRIGGVIIILFGINQLGIFGEHSMGKERRIRFSPSSLAMNPLTALLMGFTFSFAWTPCVGPALASVLIMAASASSAAAGFLLIGVYTLGFVLPFMAVGLFTGSLLTFFKTHRNVVKYTVKIGGVLMILIGVMMFTGWMNSFSSYLSGFGGGSATEQEASPGTESDENSPSESGAANNADSEQSKNADAANAADNGQSDTEKTDASAPDQTETADASQQAEASPAPEIPPAPDFTLEDQFGNTHTLSDYKGKTVFLNFWATWCPPCKAEMPEIQEVYEEYGSNEEDVIILGIASPNVGREGSAEDIAAFLEENDYTYPVVMDTDGVMAYTYGVSAYPTTFMITGEGEVFGYVPGQITKDIMISIIEQTKEGVMAQ